MAKIVDLRARQCLGTNGNYCISCEIFLDDGTKNQISMPVYFDLDYVSSYDLQNSKTNIIKSVLKQVFYINNNIKNIILGRDTNDQEIIDEILSRLDKEPRFSNVGINTVSSVSWSVFLASARSRGTDLYKYISRFCGFDTVSYVFPYFVFDIFTDPQKKNIPWRGIGIVPVLKTRFKDTIDFVLRLYEQIIKSKNYDYFINYDGGILPESIGLEMLLDDIVDLAEEIGFYNKKDYFLVLDAELVKNKNNKYIIDYQNPDGITRLELIKFYENLIKKYSLGSIINPVDPNDKEGITNIVDVISKDLQVVFDYHYFEDKNLIGSFEEKVAVGVRMENFLTATSMLKTMSNFKNKSIPLILRHSMLETTDDFLADLAIGTKVIQTDFGGIFGGQNVSKYNRLLMIEESI